MAGRFSPSAPIRIVHSNLDQEVIEITVDRLRLKLSDHIAAMVEGNNWIGYAGLFVAIVAALVTADFKDVGLSAATWQAIFILSGFTSLYLTLKSIYFRSKTPTMDELINKIKTSDQSATG